eukprot:2385890-Pleurochrysis_carterae.AAC.4
MHTARARSMLCMMASIRTDLFCGMMIGLFVTNVEVLPSGRSTTNCKARGAHLVIHFASEQSAYLEFVREMIGDKISNSLIRAVVEVNGGKEAAKGTGGEGAGTVAQMPHASGQ